MIEPPLNQSDTSPIPGWEFPLGNGQKYLEVVAWEELGGRGGCEMEKKGLLTG